MRKRPDLYTNYKSESAIFSTVTQKIWFFVLISLCSPTLPWNNETNHDTIKQM